MIDFFDKVLRRRKQPSVSMVLLMQEPFEQTKELYVGATERAFGILSGGASEPHFVEQAPGCFLIKVGGFLVSSYPRWGAYLAKTAEGDVETGAAILPEEQRQWWRRQKAWVAFDVQNADVAELQALRILSKLLLELVDDRCCGVWIPHQGKFLPNDGTANSELQRLSTS